MKSDSSFIIGFKVLGSSHVWDYLLQFFLYVNRELYREKGGINNIEIKKLKLNITC
jgi:hypothetical protein